MIIIIVKKAARLRRPPLISTAAGTKARVDRDAGIIWFVTDLRGAKDDEIDAVHDIGLVFIDDDGRAYLSIPAALP